MSVVKKYIAIGPESTGKSTLCEALAAHYNAQWCPEYAREYLEVNGSDYSYADLLTIAQGQIALEDRIQQNLPKNAIFYFVDTDMHVMRVWCEYVFNNCHRFILDQIAIRQCDGYLLCSPDLPWEADGLREYPNQKTRDELFLFYQELLQAQHIPWVRISGDHDNRLEQSIRFINGLTNQ